MTDAMTNAMTNAMTILNASPLPSSFLPSPGVFGGGGRYGIRTHGHNRLTRDFHIRFVCPRLVRIEWCFVCTLILTTIGNLTLTLILTQP